jgi:hypothetical protein
MGGKGSGGKRKGMSFETSPHAGIEVVEHGNDGREKNDAIREEMERLKEAEAREREEASPSGGEEEKTPRRRHTAKKKTKEPTAEELQNTERVRRLGASFALFGRALLKVVCERMPNPSPPTPVEEEMFSMAVSGVIEKYADYMKAWGEEAFLLAAFGFVLVPRLVKEKTSERAAPPSSTIVTKEGEVKSYGVPE